MKKDFVVALAAVLIVVAASYGLAYARPDLPLTPSEPFHIGKAPAKKTVGSKERVIMHVNGEPITEADFNMAARTVPEQQRMFFATPEGKRMLADQLVQLKALEQEGRRLGMEDDPEVRAQVDAVRAQILAARAIEKLVKDGLDARIAQEYAKEKGSAKTLRHILVAYQGGAIPPREGQAMSEAEAMTKAAGITAKLRGGADFGKVADQESDDLQTANRGGILGAARPDELPPDIAGVVGKLQLGQVSDPVKTQFGVHVFRVDLPTLEEIRPLLAQRVQRQMAEETVQRLQKEAKVEMDPKFFPPAPKAPDNPNPNG